MRSVTSIKKHARRNSIAFVACLSLIVSFGSAPSQASISALPCSTTNLSLGFGDRVSEMTGENAVMFTLTNHGKFTCSLYGYPGVSFYDNKGRVLPFKYTRSSSQYMTHGAPSTVTLRPNARAYFIVAKYRCDIGEAMEATTVRIYPPNTKKQLIRRVSPTTGVGSLSYCKGGTKEPGQIVDVSPVRANLHYL